MISSDEQVRRGRCDCGSVTYELRGPMRPVVNCHCHRCRRITGHYMAASSVAVEGLVFERQEGLRWYEASPGVFYGFCGNCGASLFWKNDEEPERVSVCAGPIELPTGLTTESVLWMAEHADYHQPVSGLVEHDYD